MFTIPSLLIFFHVTAVLVWIGSIASVGVILGGPDGAAKLRGEIALRVYRKLSVPAFVVGFLAGSGLLIINARYYFIGTHFMHGKLPLVLAIIAFHHMLGGQARKVALGETEDTSKSLLRVKLILLFAVGATFLVFVEPF